MRKNNTEPHSAIAEREQSAAVAVVAVAAAKKNDEHNFLSASFVAFVHLM